MSTSYHTYTSQTISKLQRYIKFCFLFRTVVYLSRLMGRVNFRGTLTIGSTDNPAACLMAGYKALHSALRKCRSCMATGIDIQEKVSHSLQLPSYCESGYIHPNIYVFLCFFSSSDRAKSSCVPGKHTLTMQQALVVCCTNTPQLHMG